MSLATLAVILSLGSLIGCAGVRSGDPVPEKRLTMSAPPKVQTVTLPYPNYGMARVVGNVMYVTVDSGKGILDTLLRYDRSTGKSRAVFSLPTEIAWMCANERWLVWETDKTLYAEPMGGGERSVLSTGSEMLGPTLEGDVVAWVDYRGGPGGGIVVHDLKKGERREVGRTQLANFYNNFMQFRDGKLLWTDIYGGTGHYLVHDLSDSKTTDYRMPQTRFRYPGYARSAGDTIFSINFDRYDEWHWGTQQVIRYTPGTRSWLPVTGEGESVNALVAGDGAIGIIDSEQRLSVGPADGSRPAMNLSDEWGTIIDTVQVSSDGVTTVAGVSSAEEGETRLFVFPLRAHSGPRSGPD